MIKKISASQKHHRKSYRLKGYDYSSNAGYFVTICVKERKCVFGDIIDGKMNLSEIGKIAYNNLKDIPVDFKNVDIDEFVIMPNHLHGIILINNDDKITESLSDQNKIYNLPSSGRGVIYNAPAVNGTDKITDNINQYFSGLSPLKNTLSVIIRTYKASVTRDCRKNDLYFQWQRNYHEWIIRNENHLERFRNYIYQNPLKWEIDSENPNKKQSNENNEIVKIYDSIEPNNAGALYITPLPINDFTKNNVNSEILSGRGVLHTPNNKQSHKIMNYGTNKNEQEQTKNLCKKCQK